MEELLDSSAYLTHATEVYRALLLPEADTDGQIGAITPTFEAWLRKKIVDEAGYDQIVREVLTVRLGSSGRRGGVAQTLTPNPRRWPITSPRTPSPKTWPRGPRGLSWAYGWSVPSATTILLTVGSASNSGAWRPSSPGSPNRARRMLTAPSGKPLTVAGWPFRKRPRS